MTAIPIADPKLDLVLDRMIDVPPELVWAAWTQPEHLAVWFTPRPWTISRCEIDLRPGGAFLAMMRSPEGDEFPNIGCYLEVVAGTRLTWTTVLQAGYRPAPASETPACTAIITILPHGTGTRYNATVLHSDESARDKHDKMGFYEGWGKALGQMVAHIKSMQKG